jgi:protein-tyrosine phosphatase
MIDFHSHILPAIDDGAVSIDESIAMAEALAAFGYQSVCCTPHCIKGYYDLTPQRVREATLTLQADLDNADIRLELWPGMEYMLDECFAEFADDLLPLGDTRLILCEAPQQAHPEIIQESLKLIIDKGFVPLVAHPERIQYFYEMLKPRDAAFEVKIEDKLPKAKGFFQKLWPFASRVPRPASWNFDIPGAASPEGVMFQANLGSFTGYYGESVQRRAYELLKRGVYTALASDLHDGNSVVKILVNDKFDTNPLLKKLSEWDGTTNNPGQNENGNFDQGQGDLF